MIRTAHLLAVALACLCLQGCATSREADYPAPGRLVDVGTHRMHLYCVGEGSPTLLLEAGAGNGVLTWQAVQGPLSTRTRTCSYDRSGLVWSERRPQVISATVVAAELRSLLAAAGERGPYVFVAHSIGGIFARKYIETYPEDAAGLVLVDSSHPDQNQAMPETFRGPPPGMMRYSLVRSMTGGVLGLTGMDEKMIRNSYVTMPANVTDTTLAYLDRSRPALIEEVTLVPDLLKEVSGEQDFGALPVYVIANGRQYDPAYGINARYQADELAVAAQAWRELQTSLQSLSSNSRLVVATESGHNINFEQPQVIIDTVEDLLESL